MGINTMNDFLSVPLRVCVRYGPFLHHASLCTRSVSTQRMFSVITSYTF